MKDSASLQTYLNVIFVDDHADLVEAQLPALEANQVLVQTVCSLISPGTERAALTRTWDDAGFRANPGYALAGDVIAVGNAVSGIKIGDRVVTLMNHASLSIASADPWATLKIPEGVSYEDSTFVALASVAMHAIRRAKIELGETFTVIGAGIIGQVAVQLARMSGAQKIVVVDYADNRLELARQYGADITINPSKQDAVEAVLAATGGQGTPVLLEATGNTRVIPQAFKMTAFGGRVVCVGVMEEAVPMSLHKDFIQRELTLIASFQPFCPVSDHLYWHWTQQANRQLLLEMMAKKQLHVHEMLTHYFEAAQSPAAYEKIKVGDTLMLGALLQWRNS